MVASPLHRAPRHSRTIPWSRLGIGVITAIAMMLPAAPVALGTETTTPEETACVATATTPCPETETAPTEPTPAPETNPTPGDIPADPEPTPATSPAEPVLVRSLLTSTLARTAQSGGPVIMATATRKDNGITYSYDPTNRDAGATTTDYDGTAGTDITIPDTVTFDTITYDVTSIGDYAFHGNQLETVVIGDSVTTIGDYAFGTNQLTTVRIPDSVTTIGGYAFYDNQLETVVIGDSVTSIGDYAFGTNQLTAVTIGDSVTSISGYAFSGNQLTAVTIGDSVTTIAEGAFSGNQLTAVTIGDSVITIAEGAFWGNQLTAVTIPDSVNSIDGYAFSGNPRLVSVLIKGTGPTVVNKGSSGSFGNGAVIIHPECAYVESFGSPWYGYTVEVPNATLSYNLNGHGTTIAPASTTCGTPATAPTPPTDPDWVFTGWHTDTDLATLYNFATPPAGDVTVYAGWGQAATLTGDDTVTFTVGTSASWTPTGLAGAPAPTVTADTLPAGLTLNANTGAISGTPTATGITVATLTASNGIGTDATLELTITVNEAPALTGSTTATFTVGTSASWTPTSLAGAPAPTVTADTLPAGLTLDANTGVISGTPTATDITVVTLTASNGIGTDATLELTITVETGITSFILSTNKGTYTPGSPITITGAGLPTGTIVEVSRHSTPVSLGTATADATGNFALQATLPADTSVGHHEIVATATVDGRTLTATTAITVVAPTTAVPDTTPDTSTPGPSTPDTTPGTTPDTSTPDTDAALPDTGANPGLRLLLLTGLLLLGAGVVFARRRIAPRQ